MTSKLEKDKAKQLQDKCQSVLNGLLRDEDNKYCVDCDSKGPRWASWNLGVFLCIRCAGIHRNLGVHISKVKSVNLDSWTPEQVVSLQQMGNSRARAVYEANLPDNFRRPQNDSSLESFIRAKYEHKKYIAREWVPPPLPKVNWEKEIDEEMEKQKRKKKTVTEKKNINNVEVPQLPKPKNPSPKPGRSVQQISCTENKQNSDLLGLSNGEDNFTSFLSAPAKEETKTEGDLSKAEEESFFNQTAPTEKEKLKLTKDSILALYGNTPQTNFANTYPNSLGQVAYPPSYGTATGFQNLGAFSPASNFSVQNGIPPQYPASQQFPNQQWVGMPQGNNVQYLQNTAAQFGAVGQFPSTVTVNTQFQTAPVQFGQIPQQAVNYGPTANPFGGAQTNTSLQQQFGNLSLNGQANANPTLATNIWQ